MAIANPLGGRLSTSARSAAVLLPGLADGIAETRRAPAAPSSSIRRGAVPKTCNSGRPVWARAKVGPDSQFAADLSRMRSFGPCLHAERSLGEHRDGAPD